jgi:hypothetical protein
MQGYLIVRPGKRTARWVTQTDWELSLGDTAQQSMPVDRMIAKRAGTLDAGVYLLSVRRCGTNVTVGRQIKDVKARIAKLGATDYDRAYTSSPGVAGYQKGEDLANASLRARASRAHGHARVLTEELERYPDLHQETVDSV